MSEYYTKNDYLSVDDYSQKYGEDPKLVFRAMDLAYMRNIKVHGGYSSNRPIIIKYTVKFSHKKNNYCLRPEPQALAQFQQILLQIKQKGMSK